MITKYFNMKRQGIITYRNILAHLYEQIPEFKNNLEYNDPEPGMHVMAFSGFLDQVIESDNQELLERCCQLLNRMAESRDESIQDSLTTEIFIGLIDRGSAYVNAVKAYLSPKALELLALNDKLWHRR